jgi:branched-subunit amino acid ABC-type transport system permease component
VLLFYVALYVVGMVAGLAARIVFDVQLRRPGARPLIATILVVLLIWGAISVTHTPFTDVLLPLVWAGTGLLCGFGSRELRTAS